MIVDFLIFTGVTLATFSCMEGVTWLTHKYIMHGFGWYLHEDHHEPGYPHVFEKNDSFFIVFAAVSMALFYYGVEPSLNYKFFIGLGILLYGIAYFLVHDVLIHKRFNWFERVNNPYLRGLKRAHRVHHKHMGKEDGECFGMLLVPMKYFKFGKKIKKLDEEVRNSKLVNF